MLVDRSSRRTGSFLRLAETAGPISLRGVRLGPPVSWRPPGSGGAAGPPGCGLPNAPGCGVPPNPPGCGVPPNPPGCGVPPTSGGNDSVIVLPLQRAVQDTTPSSARRRPGNNDLNPSNDATPGTCSVGLFTDCSATVVRRRARAGRIARPAGEARHGAAPPRPLPRYRRYIMGIGRNMYRAIFQLPPSLRPAGALGIHVRATAEARSG